MDKRMVLVTGASSGIGRAICERLLHDQHTVVGLARNFTKFPGDHPSFQGIELDFADLDKLPERLQQIVTSHPEIDAVICCAGRGQFGSLEEFSYSQMRTLMDLNFTSQAYVARAFLPGFKTKGRGDIVFMGSESALSGGRRGAIYCASKFALRGFALSLREECSRSGVRVSVINPGMVKTDFFDGLNFAPGEHETNYILPQDIAEVVDVILSAREGTVFDEINLSPLKKVIQFKKPTP